PALETAQRLGARNLLAMGQDGDASRLTASFARLCEEAEAFGLQVGLEFAAYTQVPTIQAARELVEAAGRPNGTGLVAALPLARWGGRPGEVAGLEARWLASARRADAGGRGPASPGARRAEARGGRYLPGEGELPLAALLDALPPDLPVAVEAPGRDLAARSVGERGRLAGLALRRLLDGCTRREAPR